MRKLPLSTRVRDGSRHDVVLASQALLQRRKDLPEGHKGQEIEIGLDGEFPDEIARRRVLESRIGDGGDQRPVDRRVGAGLVDDLEPGQLGQETFEIGGCEGGVRAARHDEQRPLARAGLAGRVEGRALGAVR